MLNVRDLERRWKYYNIKRYYPYLFSFLAFLVLLIGSSIYFYSDNADATDVFQPAESSTPAITATEGAENLHVKPTATVPQKESIPNNSSPSPKIVVAETAVVTAKPIAKPLPPKEESNIYQPQKLQPSFTFMQNINTITPVKAKEPKPAKQVVNTAIAPAIEEHPKASSATPAKPLTKVEAAPVQTAALKTPNGIKIDRTKTHQEIQDITRRFETNKNPALGLYLARYYYKIENYKKSYNYALSTNNIDPNIEEGWLIFASSQVKLGQKDDAVKTLSAYIKSTDSMNAKSLLHSIRNGAFQ